MQTSWCSALRAHYHASFLFLIQSIGLLCTAFLILLLKTFRKRRIFRKKLFMKNRTIEWMFISWSDNCSLIFRVNTTRSCEGLSSHQLGKILNFFLQELEKEKTARAKPMEEYFNKKQQLGKSLDRAGSEGSIGYSQSAGRNPVPQKIPYHEASQPPNSKARSKPASSKPKCKCKWKQSIANPTKHRTGKRWFAGDGCAAETEQRRGGGGKGGEPLEKREYIYSEDSRVIPWLVVFGPPWTFSWSQ